MLGLELDGVAAEASLPGHVDDDAGSLQPVEVKPAKPAKDAQQKKLTETQIASLLRTHKKCVACLEYLEKSSFQNSQGKCKSCFNVHRGLVRLATTQGVSEDLEELKKENEKAFHAVLRAYQKERDRSRRQSSKIKFAVQTYMTEMRSSHGVYAAAEGEMMWEGEYLEYAKSAKMGFRSRSEAEGLWSSYVEDPSVPRDQKGPRGVMRLWIKTRDVINRYASTSEDRVLQKAERLGKNPKEATLQARQKMVMGAGQRYNPKRKVRHELIAEVVEIDISSRDVCVETSVNHTTGRGAINSTPKEVSIGSLAVCPCPPLRDFVPPLDLYCDSVQEDSEGIESCRNFGTDGYNATQQIAIAIAMHAPCLAEKVYVTYFSVVAIFPTGDDDGLFEEHMEKATHAFARAGTEALEGDGILGIDLASVMSAKGDKKRKRSTEDSEGLIQIVVQNTSPLIRPSGTNFF
eukprot:6464881-Amphidinium_carterae.2